MKMKNITPHRTIVTSFSPTPTSLAKRQLQGFEYDSGEYILSVAASSFPASPPPPSSSSTSPDRVVVAAALSDRSIAFVDSETARVAQKIEGAHDGPISEVHFFRQGNGGASPLVISAGHDGAVRVWDVRCCGGGSSSSSGRSNRPAIEGRVGPVGVSALSVSLAYSGTLAAVGTSGARVSFLDLRRGGGEGGNDRPSGALIGSYVDAHVDEVTKVVFQAVPRSSHLTPGGTVLATASEDGLIALHDPSRPSEEAALLSVLNIGAPIRNVGFFGPQAEGIYALTGSETMSVHHWESAQRLSDVGGAGLRAMLSDAVSAGGSPSAGNGGEGMDEGGSAVEYLVGCAWGSLSPSDPSPALHLLAGNSGGDGYLFRVDADRVTPKARLEGGHRGCIRDFCRIGGDDSGKMVLVTGGEDARLCEWDLSGECILAVNDGKNNFRANNNTGGGPISGRSTRDNGDRKESVKRKKKYGSPY